MLTLLTALYVVYGITVVCVFIYLALEAFRLFWYESRFMSRVRGRKHRAWSTEWRAAKTQEERNAVMKKYKKGSYAKKNLKEGK